MIPLFKVHMSDNAIKESAKVLGSGYNYNVGRRSLSVEEQEERKLTNVNYRNDRNRRLDGSPRYQK